MGLLYSGPFLPRQVATMETSTPGRGGEEKAVMAASRLESRGTNSLLSKPVNARERL